MKMRKGISLKEHLDDFDGLLEDLLNLDEVIPDTYKALCLVNSLPDEYDHLVTTLLDGKDTLDYHEIEKALLNYEFRRRDKLI